ncbi:SPOR domain-containing protein [Neorhizobium turbinariae]|uniref:SPOR domain-containing protein n=1 Tax=Neorhizobium turbinariae TaxID=2937795 RepID=UPI0024A70C9D|nr:SPOR domain-containing protein [Neorhizobium turbinariae]
MADNNLARSRNDLPDFFADDDPLAELARIVGYDDLPAFARPAAASPAQGRREPAFNLEDELLQEFERYDSPHLDPANDISIDDVPRRVIGSAPALEPAVDYDEPAPMLRQAPIEPVFTEDQPTPEAPVQAQLASPAQQNVEPAFDPSYLEATQSTDFVIDELDLAAELEAAIGVEPLEAFEAPAVEEPVPAPVVPKSKAYEPGFRMPLANFNIARSNPVPQAPVVEAAPQQPVHVAPEVAPEPELPAAQAAEATFIEPEAPQPLPVAEAVVDQREEPVFEAAPTSAPIESPVFNWDEFALRADDLAVTQPEPVASPSVEQPEAPQVAELSFEPVSMEAALDIEDPFKDDDFEISLSDLELDLDLADLAVEDEFTPAPVEVAAPEPKVQPAPVFHAAPPVQPVPQPQPVPQAAAPVAPQPVMEPAVEEIAELPFDPAEIAETEEQVEAIAELDVPALPVEEPEQPPIYRPDYDIDIDAELASMMMEPEKPEPTPVAKPEPLPQPTVSFASYDQPAAAKSQPPQYSDLDDFERALEEDFRRSLAAPLAPIDPNEAGSGGTDYLATFENARRSVRNWTLPLVIAGVVVAGGLGAYAWIGSSMPGASSNGEPIIIAADTDPVKVAPENPGGKTVPNQDKAVYDRVAGVAPQEPQQPTLISSSEEPVDVVQRTLMPDTLPLEGENDIEPTEIAGADDLRLLPDQEQQAALPAEQQPVAVMPRRVKTMIVRPDGKLVEQEVPAPVTAAQDMAKVPAAGTRSGEPATQVAAAPNALPQAPAASADTAGLVPVSAPVSGNLPEAAPAAPQADLASVEAAAQAAEPAVEAPAEPAVNIVRAPIPATRPAEQPVNVVAAVTEQGTVRAPTQAPAASQAAAPAQVASLGEGGYVIQIASLPTQADAQKSYQSLSAKFGNVIGGRGVDIRAAEIAGKGTFYRVRIPAGSKAEAVALCEKYRAAGGNCLVAR